MKWGLELPNSEIVEIWDQSLRPSNLTFRARSISSISSLSNSPSFRLLTIMGTAISVALLCRLINILGWRLAHICTRAMNLPPLAMPATQIGLFLKAN
jgi:hypothetical protein